MFKISIIFFCSKLLYIFLICFVSIFSINQLLKIHSLHNNVRSIERTFCVIFFLVINNISSKKNFDIVERKLNLSILIFAWINRTLIISK